MCIDNSCTMSIQDGKVYNDLHLHNGQRNNSVHKYDLQGRKDVHRKDISLNLHQNKFHIYYHILDCIPI